MRSKIIIVVIILILITGCQNQMIIEPFQVKGDIEVWQTIENTEDAINPKVLIDSLGPLYLDYDIVVTSRDGFSVKIGGESLEGTSIVYSKETGWSFKSDHHPVNSGVKWISELVVVKKDGTEPDFSSGLNIIEDNKDNHRSMGQFLSMDYSVRYHLDGTTEQEGNSIDVMKQVKYFNLEDLVDSEYKWLLAMDKEGKHHYLPREDYQVEMVNDRFDLKSLNGEVIKGLEGIILDPPGNTVMDNYFDAMIYINKDIPVMTIFIDGFSYNQLERIKNDLPQTYMASLDFKRATTVYKPVTNAGFAAMISGKTPDENGIMDRSVRQPACDTIYDQVENGILVDGLVKILDVPCKLYLENDDDGDGYTDFEVYVKGKAVLDGDYILVHFNGIDDAGHNYGPYGQETIDKIVEVDKYVEDLVESWHGKVIIVADHGMHETEEAGDHGEFRADDLMIPYILISGGQYE